MRRELQKHGHLINHAPDFHLQLIHRQPGKKVGLWGALRWPCGQPQHLIDGAHWGVWQHPSPTSPEDRTRGIPGWVGSQGPQDGTLPAGC